MPSVPLPISLPAGASIKKSRHLPADAGEVSFEITAQPGSDVLGALLGNTPFPLRRIELAEMSIGVDSRRAVTFNAGRGAVAFSGTASAYQGIAVVDEPAEVTALLVRDSIDDDLAQGLALERRPNCRYAVLRWGYDLQGAARGSLGLGAGASASFGAEARRLGAYAVVRQVPADLGAASALRTLFESWMLPSQVRELDDIEPGTWIVAEVEGSVALSLGAQYGYEFNWVRDAVQLGGLSGDVGLKVQVGVSASCGFETSGQYAMAIGRPADGRRLRLQVFRLNRKGLNLAFSAKAASQSQFGGLLPDNFDAFVEGVFGIHGLQVLKDLDTWTSADAALPELLAEVGVDYARGFLARVTGVDPEMSFDAARQRLVALLNAWQTLPHDVATTIYSLVQNEVSGLPALRSQLATLSTQDLVAFTPQIERLLGHVDFFKTPFGKWLESAALGPVLAVVSDTAQYGRVQQMARQTLSVLDGGPLEATLLNLQRELAQRIGLTRVQQIVDQATFDAADEWLKARLSSFLGRTIDLDSVLEIRSAIHRLLSLRETFFDRARTALTKKYQFELLGAYQRATTTTALVDVLFDYDMPGASATQLTKLARAAIDGDFEQVLVQDIAGVVLKQAVLTHGLKRQTHLEVTMPFERVEMDHVNSSLAKMEAIQSERGRVLIYDLHADDLVTARGKFSSRLSVHGHFVRESRVRVFDDRSMTHDYVFRQAVPNMRRRALEAQLETYAEAYFPDLFGDGDASLATWVSDLDRTVDAVLANGPDNFGTTLLSLELSAPSRLVGAWALAPPDENANEYFAMSHAIQAQLRSLIPLCHFGDLAAYRDRIPSAALLVYAAMPPAHGITVENRRIVDFDDRRDVYWDIDQGGNIEALARHSLTVAALRVRLAAVHRTLTDAGGMRDVAADYHPNRIDRILANALTTAVGREDLRNLLMVERMVVREARRAGIKIAAFLRAEDSRQARLALADYGARVTDAFNSTIGGLFSAGQLRPLGTLVFLEAARSFAPELAGGRPNAMLELTILKERATADLSSFIESGEVAEADIVRRERFVALA